MTTSNPINNRLSIIDSFFIKFNGIGSAAYNTTKQFKSRNNMESMVMVCNWLIESHESLGTDHGYIRTKEEEVGDRDSISIISKLNIIINLMSEQISSDEEILTNIRFNSLGMLPIDGDVDWPAEGTLEIIISNAVRKKILINCKQMQTEDGDVWIFDGLCANEIELIDKMVFLIHRNNHHQYQATA